MVYANCFICSDVTTSKHVRVFKSGSKGTSFVDLHRLVVSLDIYVTVYSNLDVAVRVCITFSLKANAKVDLSQKLL